ncbi:PREDICTED: uncharacterized protein LOC101308788 [Fragaria vesca subsp. vesca]
MKLNHVIVVLVIALAAAVLHGTEAKKYQVGGDLGWTIPPGGASTYASWASKHTLKVDKDTLVFNFKAGENDSTIVTKENYDSCNTKDPLYQIKSPGVVVGASTPGTFYFTCSFAGHCHKGQREQKPKSIESEATWVGLSLPAALPLILHGLPRFNFEAGENDLILETKENFHTCNTAEPLLQFEGPVYIGSANPSTLYFTCSFAGHCQKRQKVAIDFEPPSNLACCLVQVQVHVPWPVRVLPMNLRPPNISK